MSVRRRVLWLPAHPSAGAVSMLRHWRELDDAFHVLPSPAFEIRCPLGAPPEKVQRASQAARAWAKYVTYPMQVGFSGGAEIVHVLDHACAHLLRFAPRDAFKIVTVHDLAPLEDGSLSAAQLQRFRRTLGWLNHADLLLTASEFTAEAVRRFVTARPAISALLMGVNTAAFATPRALPASISLPAVPRILSIGSALPRKNLESLPEILSRVVRECGPVALLRVGAPLPITLAERLQSVLGPERFFELGYASEAELMAIYQASDTLIFPSTIEGFGFPLVEAMAAGCAVVTSHASSLPEVGGDAALYFDPRQPGEAAARLAEVLTRPELRTELLARGRRRAAEFSWENHARKLAAIYESALASRLKR